MQAFILKLLVFITHVRHRQVEKKYRYYIRDNYYSRFFQIKYILKDFILKKRYKDIEFRGEFQQELCFVLPFAYWHYLNGTLRSTVSCQGTSDLYFFSKDHHEKYFKRLWEHNQKNYEFPNMTHVLSLNRKKWIRVPLKAQYRNELFVFDNPILVIANKYNIEWDNQPLNFLSITVLERIIKKCSTKYKIIYNRPQADHIVSDNSDILTLDEFERLREKYPEVLLMQDIFREHRSSVNNFNHLQLMVYANCQRFISVHGGTAALCSYFEGQNIIYSKSGVEHILGEFSTVFPALSGAQILHAKTSEEIFSFLDEHYL